jgi:hypothetical protein
MVSKSNLLFLTVLASVLGGCASMGIFKDSQSEPTLAPQDSLDAGAGAALSAGDIRTVLSGKSWKWQGPNNSGVTLFAEDGTSLIEVTGKGTTTGKWITKDGELCESVAPASFLPQGAPMSCRPFSGSGNNYQVGNATFSLSS